MAKEVRRTIESWGAHLNIEGEPLTMEEATLLHLGHLNARLDRTMNALEDIQHRMIRIELYMQATIPDYERKSRMAAIKMLQSERSRKEG